MACWTLKTIAKLNLPATQLDMLSIQFFQYVRNARLRGFNGTVFAYGRDPSLLQKVFNISRRHQARPHQARHTLWRHFRSTQFVEGCALVQSAVCQGPDIEDEVQMGVIPRPLYSNA